MMSSVIQMHNVMNVHKQSIFVCQIAVSTFQNGRLQMKPQNASSYSTSHIFAHQMLRKYTAKMGTL